MKFRDRFIENQAAYDAAVHARILANATKTFTKTYPRAEEVIGFLHGFNEEGKTGFLADMADALFRKYGKLSEKQYEAVCKTMDAWAEKRAAKQAAIEEQKARSKFLGVPSERVIMVLCVEKILQIECTSFGYYDAAVQDLYLMRDADGNRVILKTKSDLLVESDNGSTNYIIGTDGKCRRNVMEGDTIEVKATIKAHTEYKGEKQTLIQRAKVQKLISSKG